MTRGFLFEIRRCGFEDAIMQEMVASKSLSLMTIISFLFNPEPTNGFVVPALSLGDLRVGIKDDLDLEDFELEGDGYEGGGSGSVP